MINYFDILACISIVYAHTFIREIELLKKIKSILNITTAVIIAFFFARTTNKEDLFNIHTHLSILIVTFTALLTLDLILFIINKLLFSTKRQIEKFNKENKGYEVDSKIIHDIMTLTKNYITTNHNIFNDNNDPIIFKSVQELLNRYNIHSIKDFIYNINYIKSIYNPNDTHLNEYNFINKILYDFYNDINDSKYDSIIKQLNK